MKKLFITMCLALSTTLMFAQFGKLNGVVNTAKNAAVSASNASKSSSSSSASSSSSSSSAAKSDGKISENKGKVIYVKPTGSARGATGADPSSAFKNLQKAIENAENGDIIRIAEGNYLGTNNQGFIEVDKWITLEGGWNESFTERAPLKYITKIEPSAEQAGTDGSKGKIHIKGLDDLTSNRLLGTLIIDGITINMGYEAAYKPADPSDPRFGCPSKAFETGRMEDAIPPQVERRLIYSDGSIAGNVIIRNCLLANGTNFAILLSSRRGEIEIYNNVIISNRYSGVRINGTDKKGEGTHINFHHNTVAFSWCRDKEMGDMGYGYEFMTYCNADLHHNIFACNNYAAIARTHELGGPDKVIEAKRKTNVYDNAFFLNAADLQLPSGGGKWTNVRCANFEDVDESKLPKCDGNFEMTADDPFVKALDQDYLKGFASLKSVRSESFDRNSAANQFREAVGLNMQGTETIRVSMYGNRYKMDYAYKLFGARKEYGAQKP